jgi:acyl carrier protein
MDDKAWEATVLRKAREVLARPDFTPEKGAILRRIPGWDSLRMMGLFFQLEKELGVRFQAADLARLRTWDELLALVGKSVAANGR